MAHSHHGHREHQVSHRRVHHILKHEPDGAKQHSRSHAFSKVTSKTAAEKHDAHVSGKKVPKRYARGGKITGKPSDMKHIASELKEHERKEHHYAKGGKVKGHQTNIIIAMPHRGQAGASPVAGPPAGAPPLPPPPAGGAPVPMPMRGAPPPGTPMPMRKHGGKVGKGMTAGASTGVGRLEEARIVKRRRGK